MRRDSKPRLPLWKPTDENKRAANITRFMEHVNRTHLLDLKSYTDLYQWSIDETADFWAVLWEFADIRASAPYEVVIADILQFPGTKWFPGARLNFAENLLRFRDDRPAVIFRGRAGRTSDLTHRQLYEAVARVCPRVSSGRHSARRPCCGIYAECPRDRHRNAGRRHRRRGVVFMRDRSWCFCGPGTAWADRAQSPGHGGWLLLQRQASIRPCMPRQRSRRGIPTLERVVIVPYVSEHPDLGPVPNAVNWRDFTAPEARWT